MDDDEQLQLSAETMKALSEFYKEQEERDEKRKEVEAGIIPENFDEDWNKSQFWYDEKTTEDLAQLCLQSLNDGDRIACISCPTLFHRLHKMQIPHEKTLLEYDTKFGVFGSEFTFYDYRSPIDIPKNLRETFSLVVADPPYLSEDCLTKTAMTIKFISKPDAKIILCTGAVMEQLAQRLLSLSSTDMKIKHNKELSNPFVCYSNFTLKIK